ncbi:glycosyltransferase [Pedobacter sp. GSP4]|uniref:glycosyltransferase n=1 Tax=Pedobacter sp. GSP4 TaxID=3453716 RepID=UPI003EEB7924
MKKVLIISPYFPPANTADSQRVRMSLPYFEKFGWEAEVVAVGEEYIDAVKDPLLLQSIPASTKIHRIQAFSKKLTSKFGLGSVALRSLWYYRKKVNQLLKTAHFDLIYFSTTQFPVCILGAYWKRKFNIPYVIDMQDPWHTDYYQDKPKSQRPKKYWFSYRLNKHLEPIALKSADGLISVSKAYIDTLHQRYPQLIDKPHQVITFGAFELDFAIAQKTYAESKLVFPQTENKLNLVYIGRGGEDMRSSLQLLFGALKQGIGSLPQLFENIKLYFIGTSYAPAGQGTPTIAPVAEEFGISAYVTEYTDRIGFYESINNLQHADGLIIIGSDQAAYTASKAYPYMLSQKNLLGIFNSQSSAGKVIQQCNAGHLITLNQSPTEAFEVLKNFIKDILSHRTPQTNWSAFAQYTANYLTQKQVDVFEQVTQQFGKAVNQK